MVVYPNRIISRMNDCTHKGIRVEMCFKSSSSRGGGGIWLTALESFEIINSTAVFTVAKEGACVIFPVTAGAMAFSERALAEFLSCCPRTPPPPSRVLLNRSRTYKTCTFKLMFCYCCRCSKKHPIVFLLWEENWGKLVQRDLRDVDEGGRAMSTASARECCHPQWQHLIPAQFCQSTMSGVTRVDMADWSVWHRPSPR